MEMKLVDVNVKECDKLIFDNLNLDIPCKKIIGLYGNNYQYFINLLMKKEVDGGKIIDSGYLEYVSILNDYDHFVTNVVADEFYIHFDYSEKIEEIVTILSKCDLDRNFLNRNISTLSSCEKKLIKLIILMFDRNKTIIVCDLFNGLDFRNKKFFSSLLKTIKRKYDKHIFIHDSDMDMISTLIDQMLIVDSNLVMIGQLEDVFDKEDIRNIQIEYPNFIKLKKMILDKGIDMSKIRNINDLVKEVSKSV